MASTYPPPVVGWEFVYDLDGTVVKHDSTTFTISEVKDLNDYNPQAMVISQGALLNIGFLFPQSRNLTGFSLAYYGPDTSTLAVSTDTTDGVSGTWNVIKTNAELAKWRGAVTTELLRTPESLNVTAVKGVRLQMTRSTGQYPGIYCMHLWGTYTPEYLHFWHPTLDREILASEVDHGNLLRGAVSDKSFRLKNASALTGNSIVVQLESGPQLNDAYGNTDLIYSSTTAKGHNIGDLAPGAISSVITARRTMGAGATYGALGTVRISAVASSWT